MDCIWTEWVVANGKDAIVTSEIEESGKAYVIGINYSIYNWVASHCRGKGGGGRDRGEERGGGGGGRGRWEGQERGERREVMREEGEGEGRGRAGRTNLILFTVATPSLMFRFNWVVAY